MLLYKAKSKFAAQVAVEVAAQFFKIHVLTLAVVVAVAAAAFMCVKPSQRQLYVRV